METTLTAHLLLAMTLPLSMGLGICGAFALYRARKERRRTDNVIRLARGRRRMYRIGNRK